MAPTTRSAMEIELTKLSSPRIFLVRMLVFLVLCSLILFVLYKQIITAFFANPGLNALIGAVLLIGIILSFRQVIRLYPEVSWVNNFRIADPRLSGPAIEPGAEPVLHRPRRLARLHGEGIFRRERRRRQRRSAERHRAAAHGDGRRRQQPRHHGCDGQPRRSHPGPGRTYAHRAADDPRMGRRPGRAEPRDQETAGAPRK